MGRDGGGGEEEGRCGGSVGVGEVAMAGTREREGGKDQGNGTGGLGGSREVGDICCTSYL